MSGDHGLWLHDEQCGAPVPPKAGEPNPKYSIRCGETNSAALRPLQDGELVTQSKNLDLKRYSSPKARLQAGNRGNKKQGKHRMPRLTKALGKINDCNSNEIFSRHSWKRDRGLIARLPRQFPTLPVPDLLDEFTNNCSKIMV
jgi:hypothetical protein